MLSLRRRCRRLHGADAAETALSLRLKPRRRPFDPHRCRTATIGERSSPGARLCCRCFCRHRGTMRSTTAPCHPPRWSCPSWQASCNHGVISAVPSALSPRAPHRHPGGYQDKATLSGTSTPEAGRCKSYRVCGTHHATHWCSFSFTQSWPHCAQGAVCGAVAQCG